MTGVGAVSCKRHDTSSRCGQTILIAEDELVRDLFRTVLSARGYGVVDAADGQEALEISRSYSGEIEMLLTDARMPHANGVELAAEFKFTDRGFWFW